MTDSLEFLFSIDVANTLGEGVQWHDQSNSLWWTDIHNSRLYRFDWQSRTLFQWRTPDRLTSFGILSTDPVRLLASFATGFALYQPETGDLSWIAQPETGKPGNRFNDGRVDRQGRFWSGTMQDEGDRAPTGTLYRLDETGVHSVLRDLTIPNALCWSPDGKRMYHADTPTGQIRTFDFDPERGEPCGARLFAEVPRGKPDGAAIDSDGHLLCALFGGCGVARFSPEGTLTALHNLPVSQPTCVALGGPNLDVLLVTSATEGMTEQQRKDEPMAGHVLAYATPYRGLAECTPDEARIPK
ncbi:SMP-30/gluconolactonase/LRE family protein [Saccharospirillum alexandrii]|uniref:SMP-30/gluconolactonase/LRE family protein n=1 Tax=Saccharospirillum alexandrii TaxID=2448477 RepID=UPI003736EE25